MSTTTYTVEVMHDGCLAALEPFLVSRRGSFDTIWIARTHNLDRVKPILERGGVDVLGGDQSLIEVGLQPVEELPRQ